MKSTIHNTTRALLAGAAMFPLGAWALPPLTGQAVPLVEKLKYEPALAATPDGAIALHAQLKLAAQRVCADPLQLAPRAQADCAKQALDEAVASLAIPMVTVVHQYGGRFGTSSLAKR